jgi:hypothetical protein
MKGRSRIRYAIVALLVVLLLAGGGLVAWAGAAAEPAPEALAALQSDGEVTVATSPWYVFSPAGAEPSAGLIFYPGGRVDPRAYAPAAREIAAAGYLVAIVPMPLNLAVIAPDRANEVIAAYPDIARWAVGGHSLGGAMAARYARAHAETVDGLVLWAAYPDGSDDLSSSKLTVASIYGSLDGLATPEKIAASRALLPPNATMVAIEGGNHAQFGRYGAQAGDNEATIDSAEQQERVVRATIALLERTRATR